MGTQPRTHDSTSQANIRRLFTKNGFSPLPDQELADLVDENLKHYRKDDLVNFIRLARRFNRKPVGIVEDGAITRNVDWFHLRHSLEILPEYLDSAKAAGFSYEDANAVLCDVVKSCKYDWKIDQHTEIMLLGRAMSAAAGQGINLSESSAPFREMIALGNEYGVLEASLYAFSIAIQMGLSVEQSCRMIGKLADADGALSGYTFSSFNDALKSLRPAQVDPNLVAQTFEILGGERPYFQQGLYQAFELMITFGCPSHNVHPNKVLEMIVAKAKRKNNDGERLLSYASNQLKKEKPQNDDGYFANVSGPLVHASLPYQNKRSFNQGIRDLEQLAKANMHDWQEVGEGMWVFDPESSTWYSFGGKLEIKPGRVRHNFVVYDLSKLSKTPILCHIHPEDLEVMVAPPRDVLRFPQLKEGLTKFLSSTPSRADYGVIAEFLKESSRYIKPQAYIVHDLGVTEVRFPSDVSKLEQMNKDVRDIRDQVMLAADPFEFLPGNGRKIDTYKFIYTLMNRLNTRLPAGFENVLHPPGTKF
jgi:hypothetical protein